MKDLGEILHRHLSDIQKGESSILESFLVGCLLSLRDVTPETYRLVVKSRWESDTHITRAHLEKRSPE